MNKVQVGHDSEGFAYRKGIGYFPMIGQVGGTKRCPLIVPGGNLQEDNVSIEMAVDATSDVEEFIQRTKVVKEYMEDKVRKVGASLHLHPSVEFKEEILETFYPKSIEQGCDPDWNVYTGKRNLYPELENTVLRHGSGHIHVDCARAVDEPKILQNLVRLMDVYIKAPQWLLEGDVPRNRVQGALGNYRPKKYGVEYRSSSNIILTDDVILRHAFHAAVKASMHVDKGLRVSREHVERIKEAMREDDKDTVVTYIHHYGGKEIPV